MFFRRYRRMKRLGRELAKGTSIIGAPLVIAGVAGVIGLTALIYLKRRADKKAMGNFCGVTHVKHKHPGGSRSKNAEPQSFSEEDFIVKDEAADEVNVNTATDGNAGEVGVWIASITSKTIHRTDCSRAERISESNREEVTGDIASLLAQGYKVCSSCLKDSL